MTLIHYNIRKKGKWLNSANENHRRIETITKHFGYKNSFPFTLKVRYILWKKKRIVCVKRKF